MSGGAAVTAAAAAVSSSSSSSNVGGGVGGGGSSSTQAQQFQHVWEETNVGNSWESAVVEDAQGRIVLQGQGRDSLTTLLRQRRKRLEQNDSSLRHQRLRRDMIRYLYVILDASRWMNEKDPTIPPGTRLEVTLELVLEFCQAYFDENPLRLILVRNGEAELLTPLSSNPQPHKRALQALSQQMLMGDGGNGGEFSLQNGLEVAGRSLGHQPRHGSREIVVLCAALSTCDPGCNILTDTLPRLRQAHIRVSNFALAAELYVCRKLATETGGCIGVCLDRTQYREWLLNQTVPPPTQVRSKTTTTTTRTTTTDGESTTTPTTSTCEMVPMGFPSRTVTSVPSLVHGGSSGGGHNNKSTASGTASSSGTPLATAATYSASSSSSAIWLARTAYTCPQCQAKNAELPTECAVCGLKLVLAPHLARSFHHLFPVPPFVEVIAIAAPAGASATNSNNTTSPQSKKAKTSKTTSSTSSLTLSSSPMLFLTDDLLIDSQQDDTCCFACTRPLASSSSSSSSTNDTSLGSETGVEWLRFACPDCHNVFCFDCDAFLHERLHNCPGCLVR